MKGEDLNEATDSGSDVQSSEGNHQPSATDSVDRGPIDVEEVEQSLFGSTPQQTVALVLESLVKLMDGAAGQVFFLDITSGTFRLFAEQNRTAVGFFLQSPLAVDWALTDPSNEEWLGYLMDSRMVVFGPESGPFDCTILPVMKGSVCVALVEVQEPGETVLTEDWHLRADELTSSLLQSYEAEFAFGLFQGALAPVDLDTDRSDFLESLGARVILSSSAAGAALLTNDGLNEAPSGSIEVQAEWGDLEGEGVEWDHLLRKHKRIESTLDDGAELIALYDHDVPLLSYRTMAVIPIQLGEAVVGALVLVYPRPARFLPLELAGLQSLANAVGVSLANFDNFRTSSQSMSELAVVAQAISAAELVGVARHDAANALDTAAMMLDDVEDEFGSGESVEGLRDQLIQMSECLVRIRDATAPPEREAQTLGVLDIWDEAVAQTSSRLTQMKVKVTSDGRNEKAEVYGEWLRQVFLNLLLNSIDAHRGRRRGRKGGIITLSVHKTSARAERIVMDYSDDAGGLDLAALQRENASRDDQLDPTQLIFAPYVTTKKKGSGLGLHLIRRILEDHNGSSIDLIRSRGGVTFRIQLSKSLDR